MTFRAGDSVRHNPTGENWLLMVDEENGKVFPGGWPVSVGWASDCILVEAASDEKRLAMLTEMASKNHEIWSNTARVQLAAAGRPSAKDQLQQLAMAGRITPSEYPDPSCVSADVTVTKTYDLLVFTHFGATVCVEQGSGDEVKIRQGADYMELNQAIQLMAKQLLAWKPKA